MLCSEDIFTSQLTAYFWAFLRKEVESKRIENSEVRIENCSAFYILSSVFCLLSSVLCPLLWCVAKAQLFILTFLKENYYV